MSLEIIYLEHSGFAVKTEKELLVFDYYQDPSASMIKLMQEGKRVWVFSSHSHHDHFNRKIAEWKDVVATYFLSSDIQVNGGLTDVDNKKITYMNPYQTREEGPLRVSTYGSTDEGVSFLVEVDGWRLFHAGDLNWWHWKEDTEENQRLAEEGFQKEISRLAGLDLDLAFFPVDSRLEEYRDIGVKEFCRKVKVKQLVAMHTCGQLWIPGGDFLGQNKGVSVWCPTSPGEKLKVENKK